MSVFKWGVLLASVCISSCTSNNLKFVTKSGSFAKFITKSWKHCMNVPTLSLCFKQRSLLALDSLIKSNEVIEFPGKMISLVKNKENVSFSTRILSERDLEKHLPRDKTLQDKTLNMLLDSAYTKFLSSRSLQIRFPSKTFKESINESRGDKKKGNGFAMGAMMAAMVTIPMALAGIGLLAGKSLLVSMLALMMSALLASRKSHDGGSSSYEVISVPASGGHHHGRRMSIVHDLAYNAHESHET